MHWREGRRACESKCAAHIRRRQLADGGWNIFIGGPSEINASVKAYLALKLAGDSPNAAWMREARANVLRLGGIPQINTYGKLYLALLGQFPWKYLPTIPPEIFLFPNWFFFNLYQMSSWSRAIIAPLTILNHYKPTRHLPSAMQLHELYPAGLENTDLSLKRHPRFWAWRNFFLRCDKFLKLYDKFPIHPLRRRALKAAETWMVERMGEGSQGLSAIFPAMLNAMMALRALGYPDTHPLVQKADRDFAGFFVDDPGDFRIQPCLSPVWDSAITTFALAESGLAKNHPALEKSAAWLEKKEVRFKGDWAVHVPGVEPSGWAFEHENKYYPDTDDTMMVLMALRHVPPANPATRSDQTDRALEWLLEFQCQDGGWAAFDKDVTAPGWNTSHSPTTMPSWTPPALISPVACSNSSAPLVSIAEYRRPPRRGYDPSHPGSRRIVVRTLGSQLHLWHLANSARTRRYRRKHGAGMDPPRLRLARVARTTTAAGVKHANPTTSLRSKVAVPALPARPPGPLWASAPARPEPRLHSARYRISPRTKTKTVPGPKTTPPAPDSPAFSTSNTICIASTSLLALATYRKLISQA
jgi:hypothetical protein